VTAEFTLLPAQLAFVGSGAKHPALVGGYGAGKTRVLVMRTLHELTANREVMTERTPGALLEPTFPMIRDILLPELEYWLDALGWPHAYHKTEHRLTVGDWGHLLLLSAENYRRNVGLNLCFFGVDEIDTIRQDTAEEMWRVMRSRLRVHGSTGTGFVTGTPEGYSFLYSHFDATGNADRADRASYEQFRASSRDNFYLPDGFVDELTRGLPEHLVRAYVDGYYVNLTGQQAAYQFARDTHVKDRQPSPRRFVGMDFNVDPLVAVLGNIYTDGAVHFSDELVLRGSDTAAMCRAMRERWPGVTEVYADPAGSARSTAGASDHSILREHGFRVIAHAAHPPVRDRLAALNRKLCDGDGRVWMTVAPRCSFSIADLEQCRLDAAGQLDKKHKDRTHALDAISYPVEYLWPVVRREVQSVARW
jgi:hypothetical protein